MTAHWHTSLIRCYTIWILERCHDFFFIWMYVGNNSVLYTKVDRRHKQLNDSLTHKQHIWLHTSGTSAPVWFGKIMQIMQSLYANMSSCAKQWRHCFHFTLFVKLRVWWEREKERERERKKEREQAEHWKPETPANISGTNPSKKTDRQNDRKRELKVKTSILAKNMLVIQLNSQSTNDPFHAPEAMCWFAGIVYGLVRATLFAIYRARSVYEHRILRANTQTRQLEDS